MKRKTKVICTIGPASESEEMIRKLMIAGMDVARLNFSHGTHEEQRKKFDAIKKVRADLHLPVAIMLDTKGPEYRIKTFENKKIELSEGDTFTFTTDDVVGNQEKVSVNFAHLTDNLSVGDRILVNNGLVIFEVKEIKGSDAICTCLAGGVLSDRKSMNFPNKVLDHPFLSDQDKDDILFGLKHGIDFVAASFVSNKSDVKAIRDFLDENGGTDVEIIAKIENRSGVDNIEEICELADGIMIARGDLGVEIPNIEVPSIQKYLISKSASGKYPVEAVETMVKTVMFTEQQINYKKRFRNADFEVRSVLDAVSHSICQMAIDVEAKAIVVNSLSGRTSRMVSRFRCPVDIIGMTTSTRVWRKQNLSWGVTPVLCGTYDTMEEMFLNSMREAKVTFDLTSGDNVVLTGGVLNGTSGNTNLIKVETIE